MSTLIRAEPESLRPQVQPSALAGNGYKWRIKLRAVGCINGRTDQPPRLSSVIRPEQISVVPAGINRLRIRSFIEHHAGIAEASLIPRKTAAVENHAIVLCCGNCLVRI